MRRHLLLALLSCVCLATWPMVAQAVYGPDDVPRDHWAYEALDYLCDIGLIESDFFKGDRSVTLIEGVHAFSFTLNWLESDRAVPPKEDRANAAAVAEAFLDATTRHETMPLGSACYAELNRLQLAGLLAGYPGGFFMSCDELRPWQVAVALYEARLAAFDQDISVDVTRIIQRLSDECRPELNAVLLIRGYLDP